MISASKSNWLDRLRSSRGFPTGDEPDLDRFLSSSSSSGSAPTPNESTTHSESTQSHPPITTPSWNPPPPPPEGEFNGVLCDLFNMGGKGETSRSCFIKTSRKQPNPRFCKLSSNSNPESLLPSSSNDLRRENVNDGGGDDGGGEKDELKGYTRSEVTIIDTSLEDWKCDKWVFRKNDEWRIKDKRSKSRVFCGKKRKVLDVSKLGDGNSNKLSHFDGNGNGNDHDQVKLKKKKRKREVENLLMHQNKEKPQNDQVGEPHKERRDFLSKISHKRFPCPRPPEKVKNERSPVVLIKSIPLSNVNTSIKLGKPFHKKHPKQMKII